MKETVQKATAELREPFGLIHTAGKGKQIVRHKRDLFSALTYISTSTLFCESNTDRRRLQRHFSVIPE